nr:MAG TPA: hypothetical protein [Caudoviricetes sp.]
MTTLFVIFRVVRGSIPRPLQDAEMRHPDKVVLNMWFKYLCPA